LLAVQHRKPYYTSSSRLEVKMFDPGVLERLALIALGRAAGFSLAEIACMFAPDGRPRLDRQRLAAKAEELDRTIRTLSAMRDSLRDAAACPAPSHMECPTFRRFLQAAASGEIGARRKRAPQPPGHECQEHQWPAGGRCRGS
jgi:hypothetical protein